MRHTVHSPYCADLLYDMIAILDQALSSCVYWDYAIVFFDFSQISSMLCQAFAYITKVEILVRAENLIFGRISTLQAWGGPLKKSETPSEKS